MNSFAAPATEIAKKQPYATFGFMANGREIWFWEIGEVNPRLIAGFFSRDDLQRLLYLRQHGRALESIPVSTSIAGGPTRSRSSPRRRRLRAQSPTRPPVMAAGTGNTRTTMALVHGFPRANQREALRQAEHLFQSLLRRASSGQP